MSIARRSTSGKACPFTRKRSGRPSLSKSKKPHPQPTDRIVPTGGGNPGGLGDVGERPTPVVGGQNVAGEGEARRPACHRQSTIPAVGVFAGFWRGRRVEFQIVRDEQVGMAVVVVVE